LFKSFVLSLYIFPEKETRMLPYSYVANYANRLSYYQNPLVKLAGTDQETSELLKNLPAKTTSVKSDLLAKLLFSPLGRALGGSVAGAGIGGIYSLIRKGVGKEGRQLALENMLHGAIIGALTGAVAPYLLTAGALALAPPVILDNLSF
jgi:hypothetical protein